MTPITVEADAELSSFQHRLDYNDVEGRDRWTVGAVNAWVRATLPAVLASSSPSAVVLDVGCAEQPFRSFIESSGRRYVGMDVVQNTRGSVEILSTLEAAPDAAPGYAVILCTEVLEHVRDINAAFAGLRRLCAIGGAVVVTVPFIFPLHMEPYDYRRLTMHGLRQLAVDHGFAVETTTMIGQLPQILAMLVDDASILPVSRAWLAKVKVAMLRVAAKGLVRLLDSAMLTKGIAINSNCYLTNGIVLRAQ